MYERISLGKMDNELKERSLSFNSLFNFSTTSKMSGWPNLLVACDNEERWRRSCIKKKAN
jgi:hypothetical protein